MAYTYLLDIYRLIDRRIEDANTALAHASGDPNEKKFQQGRILALTDFKDYLTRDLNPRLPRRIREDLEFKN